MTRQPANDEGCGRIAVMRQIIRTGRGIAARPPPNADQLQIARLKKKKPCATTLVRLSARITPDIMRNVRYPALGAAA